MAIVRGPDGREYEIPDAELTQYAVSPDEVESPKAPSESLSPPEQKQGVKGSLRGGPVVIQIFTSTPRKNHGPDVTAQSAWGGWGSPPPKPHTRVQQFVIWT